MQGVGSYEVLDEIALADVAIELRGDALLRSMEARGIVVRAASRSGVAEEAGFAHKETGSSASDRGRW